MKLNLYKTWIFFPNLLFIIMPVSGPEMIYEFSHDLQELPTSQCCKCRPQSGTLLRASQRPGWLRIRGQLGGVNSPGVQRVEHHQACPEHGEGKHSCVAWCCPWLQPACHPGLREDVHCLDDEGPDTMVLAYRSLQMSTSSSMVEF